MQKEEEGKSEEMSEEEYISNIKEFINVSDDKETRGEEAFMKAFLVQKIDFSYPLDFYEIGNVCFFDKKDRIYSDKVLIVKYSQGTVKQKSERLNIHIDSDYLSDELILLSRINLKHLEITQNTCPDPDCESCKSGKTPPVVLLILTDSKPIDILFDNHADAFHMMTILTYWKEDKFDEFQEEPFGINDLD